MFIQRATTLELRGIKDEVSRHSAYIALLRDQGDRARVLALETQKTEGSTAHMGSVGGESHQKKLVILGAWDADTHKADGASGHARADRCVGAIPGHQQNGTQEGTCYGTGQVARGS